MNIVVSRRAFDAKPILELEKLGKTVCSPWTPSQTIYSKDEAVLEGAVVCTTGILKAKGGDEAAVFHFDPEANTLDEIQRHLKEVQERLKTTGSEKLEGFLFGASDFIKSSRVQAKGIMKHFEKTKVDFAALLMQKNHPWANLHFSLPKNEATVTFWKCQNLKYPKELKGAFKEVVSGTHNFEIRGN